VISSWSLLNVSVLSCPFLLLLTLSFRVLISRWFYHFPFLGRTPTGREKNIGRLKRQNFEFWLGSVFDLKSVADSRGTVVAAIGAEFLSINRLFPV